jgi:hypothetical protein
MARAGYWNHNVHYQPVILKAVPRGCPAALDVGCGDGLLAGRLLWRYSLLWTKPAKARELGAAN